MHMNADASTTTTTLAPYGTFNDSALLFLRSWIGTMFILHGAPKVFGGVPKLAVTVDAMGIPFAEAFAWMAALSEFGGGLFLLLGLGVRPAAFLVAMVMTVAAFVRHADDPFGTKELPLTYLVTLVYFMIVGGGRYSVLSLMKRKR